MAGTQLEPASLAPPARKPDLVAAIVSTRIRLVWDLDPRPGPAIGRMPEQWRQRVDTRRPPLARVWLVVPEDQEAAVAGDDLESGEVEPREGRREFRSAPRHAAVARGPGDRPVIGLAADRHDRSAVGAAGDLGDVRQRGGDRRRARPCQPVRRGPRRRRHPGLARSPGQPRGTRRRAARRRAANRRRGSSPTRPRSTSRHSARPPALGGGTGASLEPGRWLVARQDERHAPAFARHRRHVWTETRHLDRAARRRVVDALDFPEREDQLVALGFFILRSRARTRAIRAERRPVGAVGHPLVWARSRKRRGWPPPRPRARVA